mmetsp:Transcript_18701/g.37724  ORF Transcript_18701/g.37724 Transcript_18701/m.37724 type:complete len:220 (-) Transcript_18701:1184-1843(-)
MVSLFGQSIIPINTLSQLNSNIFPIRICLKTIQVVIHPEKRCDILRRIIPFLTRTVVAQRGVNILSLHLQFLRWDLAYINHGLSVDIDTLGSMPAISEGDKVLRVNFTRSHNCRCLWLHFKRAIPQTRHHDTRPHGFISMTIRFLLYNIENCLPFVNSRQSFPCVLCIFHCQSFWPQSLFLFQKVFPLLKILNNISTMEDIRLFLLILWRLPINLETYP